MDDNIDKVVVFPLELRHKKSMGELSYRPIRRILATEKNTHLSTCRTVPSEHIYMKLYFKPIACGCDICEKCSYLTGVKVLVPNNLIEKIQAELNSDIYISGTYEDLYTKFGKWIRLQRVDDSTGKLYGVHANMSVLDKSDLFTVDKIAFNFHLVPIYEQDNILCYNLEVISNITFLDDLRVRVSTATLPDNL